jgi:hypothetical protein
VYRQLMLRHADVSRYGHRLLDPTFGAGAVALGAMAASA